MFPARPSIAHRRVRRCAVMTNFPAATDDSLCASHPLLCPAPSEAPPHSTAAKSPAREAVPAANDSVGAGALEDAQLPISLADGVFGGSGARPNRNHAAAPDRSATYATAGARSRRGSGRRGSIPAAPRRHSWARSRSRVATGFTDAGRRWLQPVPSRAQPGVVPGHGGCARPVEWVLVEPTA